MGGGDKQTTTVQKSDPWGPAREPLQDILTDAQGLYEGGGFAPNPYPGNRVGGFGFDTNYSQDMVRDLARQGGTVGGAQDYLSQMMSGNWQSDQLDAVKQEALSSAIPAAVAQFSGSGMTNSTQAMDAVGRAATQAVAPYEYDAFNNMQTNAMRGVALAPGLDAASYLPAQMLGGVGAQEDALNQALIDQQVGNYYDRQGQPMDNMLGYANLVSGIGGQGGTSSGSATQPGPGMGATIGGAALGGLGTYGALAANPVTAPFAAMGGIASGLLGLF